MTYDVAVFKAGSVCKSNASGRAIRSRTAATSMHLTPMGCRWFKPIAGCCSRCLQSRFGMPAFSMTAAHLAMSLFMRSVIASGVLPRISMPSLPAFSWTS